MIDADYFEFLLGICLDVHACGGKEVTIAGGAIRDYLLGKPIKDIDVFYSGEVVTKSITTLFKFKESSEHWSSPKYEDSSFTLNFPVAYMPNDDVYGNVPIQFIQVQNSTVHQAILDFPSPLCSAYFKCNTGLVIPNAFLLCAKLKRFKFKEGTSETYKQRMYAKYPEFA